MLTRQFVKSALKRLSQTEVISRQGQDFACSYRIEHPFRKNNLNFLHSSVPGFTDNLGSLDQSKILEYLLSASRNVGGNSCSRQTFQCALEQFITAPRGFAIGRPTE